MIGSLGIVLSHDGESTVRGVESRVVATRCRSDIAIGVHGVSIRMNHRVSIGSQERWFVSSQLNGILVRPKNGGKEKVARRKGRKRKPKKAPTFNKTRTLENRRSEGERAFERGITTTHLSPQSSHSSIGFQPNLFPHASHLALKAFSPPEKKKKSNGVHAGEDVLEATAVTDSEPCPLVGLTDPLLLLSFPGLINVKR